MDFAAFARVIRAWSLAFPFCALGLLVVLAACADDPAPAPVFTPLSYGYLRPLRLNVGSIEVDPAVAVFPGGRDLAAQSPAVPADALQRMARDRLVAAGASGRAVFTVQQASITQEGGMLDGLIKVRLDIYTSGGQRAAYAEAAVARSATTPDADSETAMSSALYALTQKMMSDMNVELEFQLRRSLGDWLQTGDGTAPVPAAVEQQALPPPGSLPPAGVLTGPSVTPTGLAPPGISLPKMAPPPASSSGVMSPATSAPPANVSGGFRFVPSPPPPGNTGS